MKKRGLLLSLVIIASLFMEGCNFLPEPTSLIQAPAKASAKSNVDQSLETVAKRFLPKGSELSIPNGPIGTNSILTSDFNGDGHEEAVVLYQSKEAKNQVGAFVLTKKKGIWEKIFAKKGSGYEISWASVADVTGDGKQELLLGWKVGSLAGNVLEVYTWEKDNFKLLQKVNYHHLEAIKIKDESKIRLAIWKKDIGDSYEIELLRWEKNKFVADEKNYPSYFPKAVKYFKERTESVPDASYYWYYLADAQLKANHPELALTAVTKGMEKNMVIPSYEKFADLKEKIEKKLAGIKQDIPYDVQNAGIHLEIPKEIASSIILEEGNGLGINYIVSVYVSPEQKEKKLLFSLEIYSKDMMFDSIDNKLEKLAETEHYLYYVNRESGTITNQDIKRHSIYKQAIAFKDKIIQSVKPGNFYPAYSSLEEEAVIKMVSEAFNKYWYVTAGGKPQEGIIESFTLNGIDYRYMGTDLNTKSKLVNYLSESYSSDAVQAYLKRAKIIEHKGKMVQPNADGGSLANYHNSKVVESTNNGQSGKYVLRVPIGSSLIFEYSDVEFQKTESGWKISTAPGTF